MITTEIGLGLGGFFYNTFFGSIESDAVQSRAYFNFVGMIQGSKYSWIKLYLGFCHTTCFLYDRYLLSIIVE
jgi:hypothetical protein